MEPEVNDLDQYILHTESQYGRRQYVWGISTDDYRPKLTEDPTKAQRMDLYTCRRVDESTAMFLEREPWTPGLQEMIEEAAPAEKKVHYSTNVRSEEESARTACGHWIHRDSVTDQFGEVTCDTCIRRTHGVKPSGRDVPRGYWPIPGKYFGQDIRTLPPKYWCWVMDETNMIAKDSYLEKFFRMNEPLLRSRAGKMKKEKKKV